LTCLSSHHPPLVQYNVLDSQVYPNQRPSFSRFTALGLGLGVGAGAGGSRSDNSGVAPAACVAVVASAPGIGVNIIGESPGPLAGGAAVLGGAFGLGGSKSDNSGVGSPTGTVMTDVVPLTVTVMEVFDLVGLEQ
jgi:hypothetical protein